MQYSNAFMELLPRLRRYCRALTGSQKVGDEIVERVLERLLVGPRLTPSEDVEVVLYKIIGEIWSGAIGQVMRMRRDERVAGSAADERIASLDVIPRQAFLLVAMEGFAPAKAAQMLAMSEAEFQVILDRARVELARQVATDVLIIEGELFVASELERIASELGHRIIDIVGTRKAAVNAARKVPPGLILAAIKLADGSSGIDAVNDILAGNPVPVIFITANPELLLTGLRPHSIHVVKKPFTSGEIRSAISQALFFKENAGLSDMMQAALKN